MAGYIKLHRQMIEWEWYKDISAKILFIHCLLRANHADKNWQGILIKKGSFVTSYENLSIETGLTVRQIRTALNKLKTTGEVAHKGQNRYSIISINNWNLYQDNDKQSDKQMTSERQTNDKQATTNKNDKNEKNNKNNNIVNILEPKIFKKPTLKEIEEYCKERNNNVDPQYFFDYYESCNWMRGKTRMKDWRATIRTWERIRNRYSNEPNKPEKEIDGWSL